jgi:hypothetical protein
MGNEMSRLYDEDFYAWTQLQARELKRFAETRPNLALDLPHLAEEIRDLGKEQRNALRSWVRQILVHFLMLEHSRAGEPRAGWLSEIDTARVELDDRLTATLRRDLGRRFPRLYGEARKLADRKLTRFGESAALPELSPYTLEHVLDADWYPQDHPTPEP